MNRPIASWIRVRFHANEDDCRPVTFPPPGPYWCTGYGEGYSIVVAYLPAQGWREALLAHWPDAECPDDMGETEAPQFSERYTQPDWWPPA